MRVYLRQRIGKHVTFVLPLGGTRPLSRQPRRTVERRPASRLQVFAVVFFLVAVSLLVAVVCAGSLGAF